MPPLADAMVWLLTAAGVTALGAAAWRDVATRLIPNGLSGATLLCGLGMRLGAGDLLLALAAGAAVFAFAFALWWFGWLGGGDVKLLAAAAVLVPPGNVGDLLLLTALSGGVLSAFYLVMRGRLRRRPLGPVPRPSPLWRRILRVEAARMARGGPLPYGVAISAAAIFLLIGV